MVSLDVLPGDVLAADHPHTHTLTLTPSHPTPSHPPYLVLCDMLSLDCEMVSLDVLPGDVLAADLFLLV